MKKPTFVDFKRRLILPDGTAVNRKFADEVELWAGHLTACQEQIETKMEQLRGTFTPEMGVEACEEKATYALTVYEERLDIPIYASLLTQAFSDPDCPPALGQAMTHYSAKVDESKDAALHIWTLGTETTPFFTMSTILRAKRPKLATLHLSRQATPSLSQLTSPLFASHILNDEERKALQHFTETLLHPLHQMLKATEWNLQTFRVTPFHARYLLVYRYNPRRSVHLELDLTTMRDHVLARGS